MGQGIQTAVGRKRWTPLGTGADADGRLGSHWPSPDGWMQTDHPKALGVI